MKWRNQLLAFVCLLAFGGVGVIYFQHWVIRKPFGIILFVGEGLAPARLAPTRTYAAGAGTRLNMDSMPYAALVMNYSKDFAAPDQAAAASAIATGERVTNRAIAINGEGKAIKSIIELAREYGRATGLVTDAKLTDATNAAFYAHTGDPNDPEKIAAEFVDRGNIDFFFSSRRRHTRSLRDWSSDVCSSDLKLEQGVLAGWRPELPGEQGHGGGCR